MTKLPIFLAFLFVFALFSISAVTATTLESSIYNPITFGTDIPSDSSDIFFSTRQLNATKYFSIGCRRDIGNLTITQYDSYGTREYQREYDTDCFSVGQNANLERMTTLGVWFPVLMKNGTLDIYTFNSTKWIEGYDGIGYMTNVATGVSLTPSVISVSEEMNPAIYAGEVDADSTFAVTYESGGAMYVKWDFWDIENGIASSANTHIWSTPSLSSISNAHVVLTGQNCFAYDTCLFHFIFQGRTIQNTNRNGIYVREMGYDFFGYSKTDMGLIGIDSAIGFSSGQISGIDWWGYFTEYPFTENKIYLHVQNPSGDRILSYILYEPPWSYVSEGSLNFDGNTGLQEKAQEIPIIVNADCGNNNYTIASAIIENMTMDNLYFNLESSIGQIACGAGVSCNKYAEYEIFVGNAQNMSQNVSTGLLQTSTFAQLMAYDTKSWLSYNLALNGTIGTGDRNITIKASYWDSNYPRVCKSNQITYFYPFLDALPSSYRLYITESNQGESESYLFWQNLTQPATIYYRFRSINTGFNGLQTIQSGCICNDWVSGSCYNTTHRTQARSCVPALCSSTTQRIVDPTCNVVTTTTALTTTTTTTPCTAGYYCYNTTHLAYKNAYCFWNLTLNTDCDPFFCDGTNDVCFTSAVCSNCPSGEYVQNPYPDCSCYCDNFCALGYEDIQSSCACKSSTLDTSNWQNNPVGMFQDMSSGVLSLFGNLAIPLMVIFFAIGIGGLITVIMSKGLSRV